MASEHDPLAQFRHLVAKRARQSPAQWDASRRLIERQVFPSTLERLRRLSEATALPVEIKEPLKLVCQRQTERAQDLDSRLLKALTGLAPTKAVRALCLYFDFIDHPSARWPVPRLSSEQVHELVCRSDNPFDLLLHGEVASVLDLGAGDLSFASELVNSYGPRLQQQQRELILHCIDRLHPHSKLGGPLHPEQDRLQALTKQLGAGFGFFGDQDMFDLHRLDDEGKLARRYTLVTCWAPATPTFAYEPSRLSHVAIANDLRKTKGAFRHTRFEGEPALEVQHGARTLLFPSWKFDIVGPLALLNLLAYRGALCVLGAVDHQVFWELLAQLLEDPRYRPSDLPFTAENRPKIFGELYYALDRLTPGDSLQLADLAPLRTFANDEDEPGRTLFSFRYVRVQRGATFSGIPASSTARTFSSMIEETPPWFLTLIPDELGQ